jgi:LysR family transcriptional regulator, glycine cleavage system transcriptional activator
MRRLPFASIEAFIAVARSTSLAASATTMHLSVPALSRRIAMLEADLGVRLFERRPRGLALTREGADYFAAVAPAWARVHAATEAVRRNEKARPIRVSVMPTFAANWLVPRLSRVPQDHRAWEVELETSPDIVDLDSRPDLSCAIRLGHGPWPRTDNEPFLSVHAFPVASPRFLAAVAPARASDLLAHPLIGTDHQPEFWAEWFAANGVDAAAPRLRTFDNLQVVYEAAASGMGIALGLDAVVRPYLESGRLRLVLPGRSIKLQRQFHLVRRRDTTRPTRSLARFRAWLLREAKSFAASASLASR